MTIDIKLAVATFLLSLSGVAWKALDSKIKTEVRLMQAGLEQKDIQIESLQQQLILSLNGFKEKFEHFSTRSRGEHRELSDRVSDVENFLTKATNFEKRSR